MFVTALRPIIIGLIAAEVVYADSGISGASCSPTKSANYPAPSLANGYVARLVANGFNYPRGIKFDNEGALLVVDEGNGVIALTLDYADHGCISVRQQKTVVSDATLDHGIEISRDGSTLYASNAESAYSWRYDSATQSTTSSAKTVVTNMTTSDHTTRTLLLSRAAPGLLVITRGSTSNIDPAARNINSGHSQIKAFNLTNATGAYDFDTEGLLLGWGLRNDVGIDEEPTTGGLYSVENSVDQMERNGVNIHNTNPAEELNFLGYLDGQSSSNQGRNFGYPECYSAWDVDSIPGFNGEVSEQFAIGNIGPSNSDSMCSNQERQKARSVFHPHMAPLDILFNDAGTAAWVTFHGSWDSKVPVGYKLSVMPFEDGEPTEPATSKTAYRDVMSNADVTKCYNEKCFRPVGLAWDRQGRLFMSSDETGEIYAILRSDGSSVNNVGSNTTGIPSSSSQSSQSSSSGSSNSSANAVAVGSMSVLAAIFGALAFLL